MLFRSVANAIRGFGAWMDEKGYPDIESLRGEAPQLYTMPPAAVKEREQRLGRAYRGAGVDPSKCDGRGHCVDACWYDGIGCGYCFQVCPTGALRVDVGEILTSRS